MSEKITIDQVKQLAKLSKIELSDREAEKFKDEFAAILDYVNKLDELDLSGLKPTSQVTGLFNVTREDKHKQSKVTKKDLLDLAPNSDEDHILVNEVL